MDLLIAVSVLVYLVTGFLLGRRFINFVTKEAVAEFKLEHEVWGMTDRQILEGVRAKLSGTDNDMEFTPLILVLFMVCWPVITTFGIFLHGLGWICRQIGSLSNKSTLRAARG